MTLGYMIEDAGGEIAGMENPDQVRRELAHLIGQKPRDKPQQLEASGAGALERIPVADL